MDLFRDVLDNQLVDRHQCKMGRVDAIIAELRDGQPPRLTFIEVGFPVLARRFHPRWEGWVAAIQKHWGAKRSEPFRIPWSEVLDVGIDVDVDLDVEATPAIAYEKWLQDQVIGCIPGADSWQPMKFIWNYCSANLYLTQKITELAALRKCVWNNRAMNG